MAWAALRRGQSPYGGAPRRRPVPSMVTFWIDHDVSQRETGNMKHWSQPGRRDLDEHEIEILDRMGDAAAFVKVLPVASSLRRARRCRMRKAQARAVASTAAPIEARDR